MSTTHEKGTLVCWKWGEGTATGKIVVSYTSRVSQTIKDTKVTRDADEDNPAYLIEQDGGDQVLKSHSELERAE